MPDVNKSTLESLEGFCSGLKDRVAYVQQKYPGMPEYFRYLVGPWLSKELLPRPSSSNGCRFLLGYQNHKADFIERIAKPLVGGDPFVSGPHWSEKGSLL